MADRRLLQSALGPLLWPFAGLYGLGMRVRRGFYERGLFRAVKLPRPSVSVGNISWGGTGKTPVTDWLLDWAEKRGLRAAVLTRGYGGKPPRLPWLASDSDDPAHSGDEALMQARAHPRAAVVADPDRVRAAQWAMHNLNPAPDVFFLDDGFQRRSAGRDLDLVLLDKDDILPGPKSNWNRVIPAGTWRESACALHAASAFLIKCEPESWPGLQAHLARRLQAFSRPVFAFCLRPAGLALPSSPPQAAELVSGPYALVCAVGSPSQVRASVEQFMGRPPAKEFFFPDHHDYLRDVPRLAALNLPIICTAKDAVKLAGLPHIYALEVKAHFHASTDLPFPQWLTSWFEALF